jgi:hypothetical protein
MIDSWSGLAAVHRRGCGADGDAGQVLSKFLGLAFEQGLLAQVRVDRPRYIIMTQAPQCSTTSGCWGAITGCHPGCHPGCHRPAAAVGGADLHGAPLKRVP